MDLPDPRAERPQGLDGVALVVEHHVGGVEVHADRRAVQRLEQIAQGGCGLLAGFETQADALGGEHVGHVPQARGQRDEGGVGLVVRQEARVERHQPHPEPLRDGHGGRDVGLVLLPRRVRGDATGHADGLHRRVVLADGAEHAGDDPDAGVGEQCLRVAPDRG